MSEEPHSLPEHIGVAEVYRLAWPIIISMLSYTAMTVADAIFVGQLGTAELAAVGIAGTLSWLLLAFGNGSLRGVKIETAQRTGAGEHALARRYAWAGLHISAGIGLIVAALAPLGPSLFGIMGTPPDIQGSANVYLEWRLLGAPLFFASSAMSAWFQGRGETRIPMVSSLIANGANIGLDALLIFGLGPIPAYGIAGAAIATNIGLMLGVIYLAVRIRSELRGVPARVDASLIGRVLRVGAPIGVSWSLEVGSWTVFMSILARIGAADLAAHVLVVRLISLSFLPGHAIGEAAGVLVGQSIGAERRESAYAAHRSALILGLLVMGAAGALFLIAPGPLIAIFGAGPEVAIIAERLLAIAALMQLFDAVAMVSQGAIGGAGDTRYVMLINVASSWLMLLPLGYILTLPGGFGSTGAWIALASQVVLLAILSMARVRSGRWLAPRPTATSTAVPA